MRYFAKMEECEVAHFERVDFLAKKIYFTDGDDLGVSHDLPREGDVIALIDHCGVETREITVHHSERTSQGTLIHPLGYLWRSVESKPL